MLSLPGRTWNAGSQPSAFLDSRESFQVVAPQKMSTSVTLKSLIQYLWSRIKCIYFVWHKMSLPEWVDWSNLEFGYCKVYLLPFPVVITITQQQHKWVPETLNVMIFILRWAENSCDPPTPAFRCYCDVRGNLSLHCQLLQMTLWRLFGSSSLVAVEKNG